jgi:hypothetical protein
VIALASSQNPSNAGQAVTFTATVTSSGPETPSGKVESEHGTKAIGSATLSAGVAALTTSKLAVGTHPITAEYMGDAASAESTSSAFGSGGAIGFDDERTACLFGVEREFFNSHRRSHKLAPSLRRSKGILSVIGIFQQPSKKLVAVSLNSGA